MNRPACIELDGIRARLALRLRALVNDQSAILAAAQSQKRDLTNDEFAAVERLQAEFDDVDAQIVRFDSYRARYRQPSRAPHSSRSS
jgi:hypothetical protein